MNEYARPVRNIGGRHARRAFTLVELLAVVAIVLVLIAFMVPLISKVKDRPNDSRCLALLKIFGQGYASYMADQSQALIESPWGNCYPANVHYPPQDGDSKYVSVILRPYLPYHWVEPRWVNSWYPPGVSDSGRPTNPGQSWNPQEPTSSWLIDHWNYGYPAYGPHNRTGPSVTGNGAYWGIGSYPVHLQEIPSPSTTGAFYCSRSCGAGGNEGSAFRGGYYITNGGGYAPWALHSGYTCLNVCKLDGSVREYPYFEVVTPGTQATYGMQQTVQQMDPCDPSIPAAFRGKSIPARGYLWNGYNPGSRPEAGWKTD